MPLRLISETIQSEAVTGNQRRLTATGGFVLVGTTVVTWFTSMFFLFGAGMSRLEGDMLQFLLALLAAGLLLAAPLLMAWLLLRRRWLSVAAGIAFVVPFLMAGA